MLTLCNRAAFKSGQDAVPVPKVRAAGAQGSRGTKPGESRETGGAARLAPDTARVPSAS